MVWDEDRVERSGRDDRDERRDRDRRRRSRSRERTERRRRSRSRSPLDKSSEKKKKKRAATPPPANLTGPTGQHEEPPMSEMTEEERQMKEMLGFGSFHSTQGKKVKGNDVGAVNVVVKRKYRQYMNRKGGFNRPLDPVH